MSLSTRRIKHVRSPRKVSCLLCHLPSQLNEHLAASSKLSAAAGGKSFSESLWMDSNSHVYATLSRDTEYIQGMKTGLLDPTYYGGYTIQDAVYCYNATEYLKIALQKATDAGDSTMAYFIDGRIKSYEAYTELLFKQWHIQDPSAVSMGDGAEWYTEFERCVATNKTPFYLIIAMLPCEKLWGYLADQIQSGISDTNVYSFWIEDNLNPSGHLAQFVDAHVDKYHVNKTEAQEIYVNGLEGEFKFFESATSKDRTLLK